MGDVYLTPRADKDLFDIWASIAADNASAADRLIQNLLGKMQLAAENPMMGSPRPVLSSTARILIEGRYIAIYEPRDDGITVVAVVHGMRDPERWLR
ncbi:type II toxin-antitoxin system RelE/ParE family toxin [Alsobacter sp. KACC 23698]|uniref:Type II toxin-antitoxin system RelE/ParE family toxin n=1 Tax=Alsobacter sp. KACC 23698 TaxID=3149229 RepID=A0AAU7JJN9_9HYPH